MSERGSFCTEYIYCSTCLAAAREVLAGPRTSDLAGTELPSWEPDRFLPILAGKVGGLYPGEEIELFESEIVPALKNRICHAMRIAVLADSGERIFVVTPSAP